MPLVKTVKGQAQVLGGVNLLQQPAAVKDSSFGELFGVAFESETITGSLVGSFNAGGGFEYEEDPNFNVFSDENISGYENYAENFIDVRSLEHSEAIKSKIDSELENRQLLMNAGGKGLTASVLAQILDPVGIGLMFVPGGQVVKGAKFTKTVGMFAGAGFIASTATEAVLLNTQEIRTIEEAVIDITASTFLSGLLGAAAAGLGRAGVKELAEETQKGFNKNLNPSSLSSEPISPRHAGAAQVIVTTLEEETLLGSKKVAETIAFATPVARTLLKSKSVEARRVMSGTAENAFYTAKNEKGIATENAVETFIKVDERTRSFEITTATLDSFKGYSKRTHGEANVLTQADFNDEIGKALRANGKSNIPEVEQAAKVYQRNLDELTEQAIEADLLPQGSSSASLKQMFATEVITESEGEFIQLVAKHLKAGRVAKLAQIETELAEVAAKLKTAKGNKAEALRTKRDKLNQRLALAEESTTQLARRVTNNIKANNGRFNPQDLNEFGENLSFLTPDDLIFDDALIEKFLINDAEFLFKAQAQQLIPQIQIVKKFGRVDMADQIEAINNEFNDLILRAKGSKAKAKLEQNRKDTLTDIEAVRDLLLGRYKILKDPQSVWARGGRVMRDINFITMLGGMTVSAIPDLARHIMVNGWRRNIKALAFALGNFKKLKLERNELQKMGIAVDITLASRSSAIADVGDLIKRKSLIEKGAKWSSDKMGKLSIMDYWNDTMKTFAGLVTQDRILDNAVKAGQGRLSKAEFRKMAQLGFDEADLKAISAQFTKHGDDVKGLKTSNLDQWDDLDLIDRFKATMTKEVDSIIITPGVGDKPLVMSGEVGKTIGQFKSFMFASGNRAVIAGFQQNDFAAYSGMATMIALGSFTYVIKELIKGKDPDLSPEKLIREGFDRSGLLGVIGEINGVAERLSRGSIGLSALTGGAPVSRFQQQNIMGSLLGPSFGKASDIFRIGGGILTGEFDKGTVKAAQRMIPFNNLFYFQALMNATGAQKAIEKELVTK